MHYKNGREAKEGDFAVAVNDSKKVVAGQIHSIAASSVTTCNCRMVLPIPGGVEHHYFTLGNMYHVEDALTALNPDILK